MLFERTALSKKPEALIRKELSALREKGELSPALVFRDPYMLDFLELADTYSERDLESAILREIERFLLELGAGFAFVERQKRITLDGDDYYLDLLFFHRRMQPLVAIELKIGDFKPACSGQMELYLDLNPATRLPLGEENSDFARSQVVTWLPLPVPPGWSPPFSTFWATAGDTGAARGSSNIDLGNPRRSSRTRNGSKRLGSRTEEDPPHVVAELVIGPVRVQCAFVRFAQAPSRPVKTIGLPQALARRSS